MHFKLFILSGLLAISPLLTSCTEQTAADKTLATDVAVIGIQVKTAPRKLKANEQFTVPISILNNGVGLIPSLGKSEFLKVTATYHWYTQNGNLVVWDGIRTPLPRDIKKGKSVDFLINIIAPSEPGKYKLTIDLVQEGALWFADTGSQTATISYTVK